ncbi:hypothetical protein F5B22DRAFT_624387 [Xylaria bambusicola]|uniref:uncharacterized protein n=1 Tax=Xylaria bambusicola TaxID=326684 RepID=UPI0020089687|nr:uncharacterized protein F5B22DRAFT_624387 [Xylaria bambusicola]KAI0506305.1 hypothetical protein F5B22DRAFT_624387 [Xylaria bambusicola]
MSAPHIIAEARLSASTISFTDGPSPNLIISLRLEGTDKPISIAKPFLPQLFIATNAVVLYDTATQKPIATPTLDINWRSAPPLKLVPEMADKFVTLEPGQSCGIIEVSFDPLGVQRRGEEATVTDSKLAKYAGGTLGMHLLESKKDYTLGVRDDLHVHCWMEGRAKDLIEAAAEWRPCGADIKVLPAESFHFQVRE